jgi:hypothetical protein
MIHKGRFVATTKFLLMFLPTIDVVQRKFTIPKAPYVATKRSLTIPIMRVVEAPTTIPPHKCAVTIKCAAKALELPAVEHKILFH